MGETSIFKYKVVILVNKEKVAKYEFIGKYGELNPLELAACLHHIAKKIEVTFK